MKEYIILRSSSISDIEIYVINNLRKGYICTGGVCFTLSNLGPVYCQAMILNK